MAIRQLKKTNTIGDLANAFSKNDGTLKAAALFTVDKDGNIEKQEVGIFLLNPSSWNETKTANWAQQNVPGQSDPILQWVSSGPRTVSFQALVTADTSDFVSGQKIQPGRSSPNLLEQASEIFGSIAAAFSKVSAPQARVETPDTTDLDISIYLNYYRSLLYPIYDNVDTPRRLRGSPPLVVLYNGKAFTKYPYGEKITSNHDLWVVTSLEINITKQLPNLAPMEAVVSFQLTQYNVRSFDRNRFLKKDE